tara:strand:+ start:10086 stop:10451 length:366 start_codon:yes stop_codon:yes gene_type:complete
MKPEISPNVFIYKFPLTALSSITTRATGLYLTNLFLFGGLISLTNNTDCIIKKYNESNYWVKKTFNYATIFSCSFHTLGGLRHFIWDLYPSMLTKDKTHLHSKILFGIAIPTTVLLEKVLI